VSPRLLAAWTGLLVVAAWAATLSAEADPGAAGLGVVTLLAVVAALLSAPGVAARARGLGAAWAGSVVLLLPAAPVAVVAVAAGGVQPVRPLVSLGVAAALLGPICAVARALPSARAGRWAVGGLMALPFVVIVPAVELADETYSFGSERKPDGAWWLVAPLSPLVVVADATPLPAGGSAGHAEFRHDTLAAVRVYARCLRDPVACEPHHDVPLSDTDWLDAPSAGYRGPPLWPYGLGFYAVLGAGLVGADRRKAPVRV
jgi:hypothetical protein